MIHMKKISAYALTQPVGIGVLTVLFTLVFGMSVALATGFVTPAQIYAQVVGPGCGCTLPPAPPPPPPPPPSPPVQEQPIPSCTLSATPSSLAYGGGLSTLSWTTTAGTSARIDNGVGSVTPVASGSKLIFVAITTDYTMTVSGPGGETRCSANVTVAPPPPPPPPAAPTCTLSASPASIQTGDSSTLSWTTANANTFSIDHSVGSVTPVASGRKAVSPTVTTTYTGTATGAGGSVTCSTTVTVTTTPPPPPPPPPSAPTCTLSASPTSVNAGDHATLTWTTTDAGTFSIDNNVGSVSPASDGSTSSKAITSDTTFTGTAVSPSGQVATCSATVSVNHGGGGGGGPSCSLSVTPSSYAAGGSATLSWGGSEISTVDISNGVATATSSPGSTIVSPAALGSYTYTGTFHAQNGQTLSCAATLTVTGGGGGGGCTGNCGGGGGGTPPPTITLSALPHPGTQPLAYLYLSQIPYTGLDLGPVGTVLYWLALVGWSLALAYLALFVAVPFAYRSARLFGERISAVLNAQSGNLALAGVPSAPASPTPSVAAAKPPVAREYSTYEGFRSFAHDGALSIEDIVQGLSRHAPETSEPLLREHKAEPAARTEPVHEKVEPIYENVETIATAPGASTNEPNAAPVHVRGFAAALVEGDRAAVFAGLREQTRGGGKPEQLLSAVACLLDDVYRSRIDGTMCDADMSRIAARLDTPRLEQLIAALANAIDSSYSTGVTGAKLALTRALAVLGA